MIKQQDVTILSNYNKFQYVSSVDNVRGKMMFQYAEIKFYLFETILCEITVPEKFDTEEELKEYILQLFNKKGKL